MKLIDKEALLLALRKKRYSKQSLDLIESQPVVDAIPVYWLNNWCALHIAGCQSRHATVSELVKDYFEEMKENETN